MSALSLELIAAYRATDYRVYASPEPDFILRIDCHSPELASLHAARGVTGSAHLTAWNPLGAPTPLEINRAAQGLMLADLLALNAATLPGFGVNQAEEWPGEEHVLAIGVSRDDAIGLGRKYNQNAIVWSGVDAIPELILLK
ncbi:MAG: DUF3293 domain-containing protein [Pseudomonadota bacterium]